MMYKHNKGYTKQVFVCCSCLKFQGLSVKTFKVAQFQIYDFLVIVTSVA